MTERKKEGDRKFYREERVYADGGGAGCPQHAGSERSGFAATRWGNAFHLLLTSLWATPLFGAWVNRHFLLSVFVHIPACHAAR